MKKIVLALILGTTLVGLTGCKNTNPSLTKTNISEKNNTEQVSKETSSSSVWHKQASSKKRVTIVEDKNTSQSSSNEIKNEKVSDDPQAPKKSSTIRDKKASQTPLAQARITLYKLGIDSSSINDKAILEMWNSSKGNKEEYVQSVRDYLGQ